MAVRHLDFAVIGAGVAGLTAALSVDSDCRVGVFSKQPLGEAASGWAQGGIAAALNPEDSFTSHQTDTEQAGDGLCHEQAVRMIIESAPAAIDWLCGQGVAFNSGGDGDLLLTLEGGHSHRRIVHIDDRSGQAVLAALINQVSQRDNIVIYDHHIAVDLLRQEADCNGFYALNINSGEVETYSAGNVLLATGGAGRVYLCSSTPADATGDGIGIAYRAGCRIRNMEFVQFHPTCLYHPQPPTLLISEAVRGEGGRLVNKEGREFVIHPQKELAARDIIARAIDTEMKRSGADCVYLDCRAKTAQFWQQRFPNIFAACAARGIRIPEDLIPVVPAAHYCCGGVATNLEGLTDINHLYAVGEVASTGLHGANRLASNSLLECLVMGRAAAAAAPLRAPEKTLPEWNESAISPALETVMVAHNWEELRRLMWNYVGIVRSDERLQRARQRVKRIQMEIEQFYRQHKISRDFLELRNLAQCAELIIEGALARRESRGLHYNIDCNDKNTAADTELTRYDFQQRRLAINETCPFSDRMIVAGAMTMYRGYAVGFCNPQCRNTFAQAAADNFAGAKDSVVAAKKKLDTLVETI